VFGHHFAAIAGPGPLVGPTLAAQFGFLPGMIWILVGVALGGAVQDFVILAASVRRNGKSLGQMAKDEIGPVAGFTALIAVLGIMIVLIAVLALVVVNALGESPWGVVTVGLTIPIALPMGGFTPVDSVASRAEATAMNPRTVIVVVRRTRSHTNPGSRDVRRREVAAILIMGMASSRRCCPCGCCSLRAISRRS
jgi:carbon starvation protein